MRSEVSRLIEQFSIRSKVSKRALKRGWNRLSEADRKLAADRIRAYVRAYDESNSYDARRNLRSDDVVPG